MTALRAWLSAAAVCAVAALSVNGIVHPLVALLSAALALGGIWAGDAVGGLLAGTWVRVAVGVAISGCLAGTSLWLDGGRLPALWSAILIALVTATALERPAWRSLASLPWAVGMLLLLPAITTRGPATVTILAAGLGADLLALVAAQRLRAREAAPDAVRFPAPVRPGAACPVTARPAGLRPVVGLARWYLAPVALVGLLTLLAMLLALGASRQQNLAGAPGAAAGPGDPRRGVEDYTSGVLDLRARGKLPTTHLYAVSDTSAALWRAAVLDAYDGDVWWDSLAYEAPQPLFAVDEDQAAVTGDGDLGGRTADAADAGFHYDVKVLVDDVMPVISPGVTTSVSAPAMASSPSRLFAVDSAGRAARSFSVSVGHRATTGAERDAAALRAAATGPGRGEAPGESTPEAAARWKALPGELPRRDRDLAARVAGDAPTRYDAVLAVETWLRTNATYELDSPVPPVGQDAVDHFLFEARTGFCEQFAAAEVVMLRSLGIPARMATGWSAPGSAGAPQVLRGDQAHAWAEVWFPGVGWASSDPTRGVVATPRARPNRAIAVIVLVVLTGAPLVLRWWIRRRRHRSAGPGAPSGGFAHDRGGLELAAAFHRLEHALAASGRPRLPNESLAELARQLLLTLPTLATRPDGVPVAEPLEVPRPEAAPAIDALAVFERLLYAAAPPGALELAQATADLDAVTAAIVAAGNPAPRRRAPEPVP